MDKVKQAFDEAASKIPKGVPKGGGPGGGAGKLLAKFAGLALGLGFGGYGLYHSIVTVRPGHLGVIYNRFGVGAQQGIQEVGVCREGLNFVIPWFQRAIIYDVRTRPKLINSTSGSKDLQMVEISLRVLFKPDPHNLPFIYRRLGYDFDERVLPSIVNEVTKAVVARFNASELLTKREAVSKMIRDMLMQRAADFHILLDDVSITHLAFSKDYTAAVEAKQVAQQDAERARYIVDKALQEKRSIVIRAEGEAAAAELVGKAIQANPAFIQLRRIDAARDVASMVAGSQNKVYLNADNLLLNHLGEAPEQVAEMKGNKGWFW